MENNLSTLLKLAVHAAKEAGTFLKSSPRVDRTIQSESDHDIKINADIQSEKIILDVLTQGSTLAILSEEKGQHGEVTDSPFWVVDPIDGTFNFERKIPVCCVSIGLWQNNDPLLGVVYDFNHEEIFTGIASGGAWLNDKAICVSTTPTKNKGVLYTGFPAGMDFTERNITSFVIQSQKYCKSRLIGSAALSLAYVACGRGDAYAEQNIKIWDVAGGLALIKGAGGYFQMEKSNHRYSYNIQAANNKTMLS